MDNLKFYLLLFVVFCTTDISCSNSSRQLEYEENDDNKIVNGTETEIEYNPYQAYLLLYDGRGYYGCGGSIVSKYYIVTAAHCLSRILSIQVRIGSTYRNSGGYTYNTTTFYSHPQYNDRTSDYDVGILVIYEGMYLDGYYAREIRLVNIPNDPTEGEFVIITGWGDTTEGGTTSDTLRVAQVPVVSRANCNTYLGGGVTSRMFCAGYNEGGVDTCQGDSGGPAVLSTNGTLAGITSYGYGCARPRSPGVYTRVGNPQIRFYIWIMTGV